MREREKESRGERKVIGGRKERRQEKMKGGKKSESVFFYQNIKIKKNVS